MGHYGASKQTPTTQPLAPWAWSGEVEGGVLIGLGYWEVSLGAKYLKKQYPIFSPEVSILIGLHHSSPELRLVDSGYVADLANFYFPYLHGTRLDEAILLPLQLWSGIGLQVKFPLPNP